MTGKNTKSLIVATALAALAAGGVAVAQAQSSTGGHGTQAPRTVTRQGTPDDCIRMNQGDYNACNVGNAGAGNLPYLPVGR